MLPQGTVLLVMEESYELQPQNDLHVIRICQRLVMFTLGGRDEGGAADVPGRLFIAEVRDDLALCFCARFSQGTMVVDHGSCKRLRIRD